MKFSILIFAIFSVGCSNHVGFLKEEYYANNTRQVHYYKYYSAKTLKEEYFYDYRNDTLIKHGHLYYHQMSFDGAAYRGKVVYHQNGKKTISRFKN